MNGASRPKKTKLPDKRPARVRYWMKRQLEKNKVKRMCKAFGLTEQQAIRRWDKERKGRVKFELYPV